MSKKLFFSMFAFAAILCSSVLTSCGDDDPDPIPDPEPAMSEYKVDFVTIQTPEQMQYFSQTYNLKYDGTSKAITVSDMKDVTNDASYAIIMKDFKNSLASAMLEEDEIAKLKVYAYTCGTYTSGTFELVSTPMAPKSDHPTDGVKPDVVESSCFMATNTTTPSTIHTEWTAFQVFAGVNTDEESLQEFAELLSEETITYKL